MTAIRNTSTYLILTGFISLFSCNLSNKKAGHVWSDLPKVTSLDSLKQTDFITTLEDPITESRNIIYAPAFLYAWDKVRNELKFPIIVSNTNSDELRLLHQSVSHHNSLADTEYAAEVQIADGAISVRAFFNKTLPFETKMQASETPMLFDKTKVSAFGMYSYHEDAVRIARIIYYKDDDHFILKLLPKDKQHEILLVKGLDKYQTLKNALDLTNNLINEGKQEQGNNTLLWKYEITQRDMFSIPAIRFNIATNYKNLEGQSFLTKDNKTHIINEASQRTGFILNENGAVAESEVYAVTDSIGAPVITHPKKMVFDKPFLIILKRVNKTNPYFVMEVANAELLMRK